MTAGQCPHLNTVKTAQEPDKGPTVSASAPKIHGSHSDGAFCEINQNESRSCEVKLQFLCGSFKKWQQAVFSLFFVTRLIAAALIRKNTGSKTGAEPHFKTDCNPQTTQQHLSPAGQCDAYVTASCLRFPNHTGPTTG